MNTTEDNSRKRSAADDDSDRAAASSSTAKRLCQEKGSSLAEQGNTSSDPDSPLALGNNAATTTSEIGSCRPHIYGLLSIKDLLAVPLEFIFRQCPPSGNGSGGTSHAPSASPIGGPAPPPQRLKPLLSRNEASCLIRIHVLAAEVDVLIQCCAQVLMEQVEWMTFHDELVHANLLPLRALLPSLLTLGRILVQDRLHLLQSSLTEVLNELELLAENLRQSREANWDTADALLDAGVNNTTSLEKRHLGDIQDELAQRIDSVVKSTVMGVKNNATVATAKQPEQADDESDILATHDPKSMAAFCHDVWKETEAGADNIALSPLRESSSSQNSRVSAAEPTGKENAPSQHALLPGHAPVGAETQHAAFALSNLAYSASLN